MTTPKAREIRSHPRATLARAIARDAHRYRKRRVAITAATRLVIGLGAKQKLGPPTRAAKQRVLSDCRRERSDASRWRGVRPSDHLVPRTLGRGGLEYETRRRYEAGTSAVPRPTTSGQALELRTAGLQGLRSRWRSGVDALPAADLPLWEIPI